MKHAVALRALTIACLATPLSTQSALAQGSDYDASCFDGAYRLSDGSVLEVRAVGEDRAYLHHWSGTATKMMRGDGKWSAFRGYGDIPSDLSVVIGVCSEGLESYEGLAATRLDLPTVESHFFSQGTKLTGRLTLPEGGDADTLMILGHGSERVSALVIDYHQRLYAAMGIATFVYDKRGTGQSQGEFSENYILLAEDMAAAAREAQRLMGKRPERIGYRGTSQAGWIIPLAAEKEPADFAIVATGVAESPMYEDRNEVLRSLRERGYGEDVLEKARLFTAATARIIHSQFTEGFDEYDEVRAMFEGEEWLEHMEGDFTHRMAPFTGAQLKAYGEANPPEDIGKIWDHDAAGVLKRMTTPLLWLLAQEDSEGASLETKTTLVSLACAGNPFTLVDYRDAEHGVRYFETAQNGERMMTDYAPSLFANELSFAKYGAIPDSLPDADRLATDC